MWSAAAWIEFERVNEMEYENPMMEIVTIEYNVVTLSGDDASEGGGEKWDC